MSNEIEVETCVLVLTIHTYTVMETMVQLADMNMSHIQHGTEDSELNVAGLNNVQPPTVGLFKQHHLINQRFQIL